MLTNYAQPEQAIPGGIAQAAARAGLATASINPVIHGTTVVTNALIERRWARVWPRAT